MSEGYAIRRVDALGVIARHRRHVEQSPGVGVEQQTYALDVLDDIEREIKCIPDAPRRATHRRPGTPPPR